MNTEQFAGQLVAWLRSEAESAGARGVVFGLSGGVDSAVLAKLARRAFPETHLALILPAHSDRQDIDHARLVVTEFRLNSKLIELDTVYESFAGLLGADPGPDKPPDLPLANLKARLWMTALYYHANKFRYLVAGTGNRSEMSLGYFTKYGDGGVDLLPLGHLVKSEVVALADCLEVPREIIEKPPSAGIWAGQTDEKELGFTYEQLEEYVLGGLEDQELRQQVETRRRANAHKLRPPRLPPPPSAM
ncbi:MAG TPA: NAD(+) synthase [Acidobacteriota bacterium]|nr:NAD(+) synthase [Acidobacteriota bacterium]